MRTIITAFILHGNEGMHRNAQFAAFEQPLTASHTVAQIQRLKLCSEEFSELSGVEKHQVGKG